jgi:hypothetical protein
MLHSQPAEDHKHAGALVHHSIVLYGAVDTASSLHVMSLRQCIETRKSHSDRVGHHLARVDFCLPSCLASFMTP